MGKQKQTKKELARKKADSKPAPIEEKRAASGWRRSGFKASSTARRLRAAGKA